MDWLKAINRALVAVETVLAGVCCSSSSSWFSRKCSCVISSPIRIHGARSFPDSASSGFPCSEPRWPSNEEVTSDSNQAVKRLSPESARWARGSATALVMAVALLLVISGLALVRLALGQHSPALDVPMAWVYAAVPVSGVLMLVHLSSGEEGD